MELDNKFKRVLSSPVVFSALAGFCDDFSCFELAYVCEATSKIAKENKWIENKVLRAKIKLAKREYKVIR